MAAQSKASEVRVKEKRDVFRQSKPQYFAKKSRQISIYVLKEIEIVNLVGNRKIKSEVVGGLQAHLSIFSSPCRFNSSKNHTNL